MLIGVRRELKKAAGLYDDDWAEPLRELAAQADLMRKAMNNWRKKNA